MSLGPTLITERLILRPPAAEDLDGFIELMSTEQSRFIGGPMVPALVWRSVMALGGAWALEGFGMFSILERDTGRWVGRGGPWRPLGWPAAEVGWGLLQSAQGKGYATEAATAAVDFAFDVLGWARVTHVIAPDNLPSQAVARRLGSTNLGPTTLPAPMDQIAVDLWGQTREQWRARAR